MDSFEQYEKAKKLSNGGENSTPPEAPKLPGPNVPERLAYEQKNDWKETMVKWTTIIRSIFAMVLMMLLVVFVAIYLWSKAQPMLKTQTPPPVKEVVEQPKLPVPVFKDVTDEIKKHKGDAQWLRHLLRKEKENHATTKVRLKAAQRARTADEKYHRFLKYALDKFYSTPFRKGEKHRSICFTTDNMDRKCYQLNRPTGWFDGNTVLPTPAKLIQK